MFVPKTFRQTRHINRRVTQSIFRAFDYAHWTGRSFNTYVVVNFDPASKTSPVEAFHKIRHKFRDRLSYASGRLGLGFQTADYVFAFENQAGLVHVNWVLHLPPALFADFEVKLPRWLKKS